MPWSSATLSDVRSAWAQKGKGDTWLIPDEKGVFWERILSCVIKPNITLGLHLKASVKAHQDT